MLIRGWRQLCRFYELIPRGPYPLWLVKRYISSVITEVHTVWYLCSARKLVLVPRTLSHNRSLLLPGTCPALLQKRRTPAAVTSTCQRPTQKKHALEFPKAKMAEIWLWPFTVSLKNFVRLYLLYREFWWKNQVHRCIWRVSSSAAMEKSLRYAEDMRFCD